MNGAQLFRDMNAPAPSGFMLPPGSCCARRCWVGIGDPRSQKRDLGHPAEDGFEEVAAEDAFFVADCGEVGASVPLLQEREIRCESGAGLWIEGGVARCCQKLVEAVGHDSELALRISGLAS